MIDPVEALRLKPDPLAFRDAEVLHQADIPVLEAGRAYDPAVELTREGAGGGRGEDRRAVRILGPVPEVLVGDPLTELALASRQLEFAASVPDLGTAARTDTGKVVSGRSGAHGAGLELRDPGHPPSAGDPAQQRSVLFQEGQIVDEVDDRNVAGCRSSSAPTDSKRRRSWAGGLAEMKHYRTTPRRYRPGRDRVRP